MDFLTDQIRDITEMSADEAGLATAKFIKENLFYLNCIHSAFAIHRKGCKNIHAFAIDWQKFWK